MEYSLFSLEGGGIVTNFIITLLGVFLGDRFMKGISMDGFQKGLIIAFVLAILNATIGAAMDFISTPIRWLTLGLFSFVVDAFVIILGGKLISGFHVDGFWSAVGLAVIISVVSMLLVAS